MSLKILPQIIELWGLNIKSEEVPKKSKTNRKTNDYTLVFTKGSGTWSGLSQLTIGLVNDMFTEKNNDEYKYKEVATQEDFDKF